MHLSYEIMPSLTVNLLNIADFNQEHTFITTMLHLLNNKV